MLAVANKPDYKKVMAAVRGLHSEFDVNEPPVNPVELARERGINVIFATFSGDADRISGFFDFNENAIYVNSNEYPLRQTFTVAHELGHSLLHREWAASDEYKILFRDAGYDSDDVHEKEANAFAAHLLVPRFMLDRYWRENSLESLSQLFAVSVPMIKNRLAFEYGV